jgi:putative Mg2+ transporter-C (MgtC) family protein
LSRICTQTEERNVTGDELAIRVGLGAACGILIGLERAREHKVVGTRTLGLVGLASALLIAVVERANPGAGDAVSRVIQGLITGVGFLGAGVIMHGQRENEVHGLTTAAAIWATAILGIAAGLGEYWGAGLGALAVFTILAAGGRLDRWIGKRLGPKDGKDQ